MRVILAGLLALFFLWPQYAESAPKPTPIITFNPTSVSVLSTLGIGSMMTSVHVTMSNGSSYTGGLTLTNSASNVCAKTGSAPTFSLNVGKALTGGQYTCTVQASQGGITVSKSVTITVTTAVVATPTVSFNPTSGSATTLTTAGTPLTTISVMMSDNSSFNGTLAFGGSNGDGGGVCTLSNNILPSKILLATDLGTGGYSCSVVATQGNKSSVPANFPISVTAVTPTVTLSPTSATIQNTTAPGSFLSNIAVSMSDGSMFMGNLAFGGTNGNGGGACALSGVGPVLNAPTTGTLLDAQGTWSFGPTPNSNGYPILLNNQPAAGGAGNLILAYNGQTYVENALNQWFLWTGTGYNGLQADPRPTPTLTLGKSLTANTYNCSVVATQGPASSAPANFAVTVMAAATPTVVLVPSSTSKFDNTPVGMPLSAVSVTMSDGSTFTGTLGFGTPYSNDGGICVLSSNSAPTNLTLGVPLPHGTSTQNCTITATQGVNTASANMTISVTSPTPVVTLNPSTVSVPSTTPKDTLLSTINVTMSDGSTFNGTEAFGSPNNNGGGVCELFGVGATIVAPTASTLVDSDGTWSFGSPPNSNGYPILLNNQPAAGGFGNLILSYNGHTYVQNAQLMWYLWNGAGYNAFSTDPRASGSGSVAVGQSLTAGSYNCSVVATQGSVSSSPANIAVGVTSAATPTVTLGSPSPTILDTLAVGQPLSTIAVSMSDSSTFTGTLALSGTYGNGNGACALSGSVLPATVNLGEALADGGPYNCSVVATQGVAVSPSANIAVTVVPRTLSLSYNPAAPMIPDNTPVGSQGFISNVTVSVSDGSQFTGTLAFTGSGGSPGNYGNGGGVCVLAGGVPMGGTLLTAPTNNTLVDSDGTWSFGPTPNSNGYPILLNNQPAAGGFGNLILSYNGHTYVQNSTPTWFQWTGNGYNQLLGDPRPVGSGSTIDLGVPLSGASTQHCTITATE